MRAASIAALLALATSACTTADTGADAGPAPLPCKGVTHLGYGGGRFLMLSSAAVRGFPYAIAYSDDDGVTWTAATPGAPLSIDTIAYGNGAFVTVGIDNSDGEDGPGGYQMRSPEGVTWTNEGDYIVRYGVAFGDGIFHVPEVTNPNALAATRLSTSPDGIHWTTGAPPPFGLRGISHADGEYVVWGTQGFRPGPQIATSTDGVTWQALSASWTQDSWVSVVPFHGGA